MRICKRMVRGLAYALALLMVTNFGLFWGLEAGVAEEGTESGAEMQAQAAVSAELLDEVPEGLLCIGVLPTQTGGVMKYYVPDEQTRDELYSRISKMDVEKLDSLDIPPQWVLDAGELNITVKYGEYSLYLFDGGVMRIDSSRDYTTLGEWVVRDAEVGAYILGVVENEIGMQIFDPASIKDVVGAELMVGPLYAGQPKESLLITDAEKLAKIEALLSGAGKSFWSKCPFGNCKLVLTTGAGEEITLAVACDSCTVFYADGCFFDYMPEEYRNSDEHPDNSILFELFGVTPEYFLAG